jgi:hypothetical protein
LVGCATAAGTRRVAPRTTRACGGRAVGRRDEGAGLGRGLLRDAMLRTLTAAGSIGVGALIVHARDDAAGCYGRHGFETSPTDALHRILLLNDLGRRSPTERGAHARPRAAPAAQLPALWRPMRTRALAIAGAGARTTTREESP